MVVSPNLLCSGNSCDSKGLRSLGSVFLLPFVILVQKQHFNIKLLTSPSYSSLQTSYSTLHIKLHASHQTPRNIKLHAPSTQHPSSSLQRHHHQTAPTTNEHRVDTITRDGWRSGKVSRAELPRKQCHGASSAGVPAKTEGEKAQQTVVVSPGVKGDLSC